MKSYGNTKKESFLSNLPVISLESNDNKLTEKCKFNFAYFNASQGAAQDFSDWSHLELIDLLNKLKDFSEFSLLHWQGTSHRRQNMLEIYGKFPSKSDFTHPKNIPVEAQWGRFAIKRLVRLIGFIIPEEFHNTVHPKTNFLFDKNTFYVVFLDRDHKFYKS